MNAPTLILLSLAALSPTAAAELVVHDSHVSTLDPSDQAQLQIPRFDPTLGTLDEVRVELHLATAGGVGWENLSTTPRQVTTTFGAAATVRLQGGPVLASTAQTIEASWLADGFDGKVDYAGASGRVDRGLAVDVARTETLGADLFWSKGILPHAPPVELTVELADLTHVGSNGELAVRRGQRTEVEVEVTYVFTPHGAQTGDAAD